MKDSIVVDMRYAGYDMIDGTPNVHRHHILREQQTVSYRMKTDCGCHYPMNIMKAT